MLTIESATEHRLLTAMKDGSTIIIAVSDHTGNLEKGATPKPINIRYARFSTINKPRVIKTRRHLMDFSITQDYVERNQPIEIIAEWLFAVGWNVQDHRPTLDEQPPLPDVAAERQGNGVTWVTPKHVEV